MKVKNAFHEFVMGDLFGNIPGVTSRAMFGGWGIYQHGIIFAIIVEGTLYLKAHEESRADFERYHMKPFTYYSPKGKKTTMSYWELPEEIMEDREELVRWVHRAVQISKASK